MKLHRKLAGLVSAAVVLSSLSVGAFAASPSDFADMPSDWSRPALENAINNGLLNGSDGKINASGLLTRAELAAIVNRAFGATKTADISAYTDVPASAWYYADMQKAVHMGTFEGSNGKLSPASAITRQEAFTVLARAFSLADGSASSLSKFSDASAVSSWAKGPVAALTEAGYVNGSGGKLNPTASITRAEFAQIADNLVSAYLPKEYTGTADGNAMVREAGAVLDKADIKGDLILGDGVDDGNVTIRDSKVAGRLVVRGGGVHSIIISGSTEIGTVVVSKVDGNVRVATEGNAKVQTIVVDDGKDDVIIEGTVGKVEIASANVPVVLQNAKVDEVVVSAAGADVTVDKNSTVKTVTVDSAAANTALTVAGKVDTVAVQGDNTTVTAEKGATIAKVQTAAANTEVKGDGKVTKVEAQAGSTGAKVTTPGTSITVDKGADAVKTDKGTVEPGKTGSTSGTTTGGGGGGGGGSSTTTETLEGYLPAPLADGAVTDYKVDVTKTSNRDYIDVKVSGTNLQYSLNADTTYHLNDDTTAVGGFWAGVAVPVPEKADAAHTQFSWTAKDWADAETSARAFKAIDGQSYVVVYSDLSMTDKADHLQIVWKDAEGKELSTQKFVLDYSGVTVDKASKPVAVTWTIGEVLVKTDWVRTGTVATLPTDAELASAGITVPEGQQLVWFLNGEIYKDTAIADTSAIVGVIGSDKFSGGNGTADYPYIVMTADQFAEIASLSEDMKSNALSFKLGADVDLSAVDKTFNIPYFAGSFDGNGHKLTVDKANYKQNTELFEIAFNAVFKDLTLDYVDTPYSLIGYAKGDSIQFVNVDVEGRMNFGASNNSTAYIWLTLAARTSFEDCDNRAALTNTDNSDTKKGTLERCICRRLCGFGNIF
ncbi:S-layer homology domain-containing protein [Agathobaculum sp. NTUH-O15-33]|uniref:S-layer homology domain-containing protein n=1 Tax=Agathobaculum sp. NTUH-O15-33 TaxID=3079302 RepID=UPI002958C63A|nr:S-layer homology domain-containing protein [Agathobaculum sp. NTUH-O15-33]WNX84479.1 S-layer homology domain-containing protein [Agathobaculum sp. NTUH-O15-33]